MRPFFFVENFFSRTQFPLHFLAASSEEGNSEAWRVGTGRRSRADRWMPAVLNTTASVQVECMEPRDANAIAIDRGHNLGGRTVKLQGSYDGVAWADVITCVIPAAAAVGGSIDAANGVTTEEGAWLKRFAAATYPWWRLNVPAMGVGLRPEVVGLWVGAGWVPSQYFDLPWSDEGLELGFQETQSDAGWIGTGQVRRPRAGTIDLKLGSSSEYENGARYHLWENFWRRRPMWIVYDDQQTERAVLAVPRPGQVGFGRESGWSNRQAKLAWIEHEARP